MSTTTTGPREMHVTYNDAGEVRAYLRRAAEAMPDGTVIRIDKRDGRARIQFLSEHDFMSVNMKSEASRKKAA